VSLTPVTEGIGIALDSIRANKVRAALTILGVAIGVMVVMAIGSMIRGINKGVEDIFAQLGPRTFFVVRHFQAGINFDDEDRWWLRKPPLQVEEAERIQALPSIALVVISEDAGGPVSYNGTSIAAAAIIGRGVAWPQVSGGDLFPGRSFTNLEYHSNALVAVVNRKMADNLFGLLDPIGKSIRINGVPFTVIGVHNPPPDLFGEGNRPQAIVPHSTFKKHVRQFGGWMHLLVQPVEGVTISEAIDDVTVRLRTMRGQRPMDPNSFDVITQDKFLEAWGKMTSMFFVVMIALSSVGLMVGGVGVIAVMMISVTERTREIGVRKALGAKRREILWQFLVEAATLTLVGGAIGMAMGAGLTIIVKAATPLPAAIPLLSVVAALTMSIFTGIVFGLYPAAKAARLDPVEALRYE
jgi:putative ABC transport system permease protein